MKKAVNQAFLSRKFFLLALCLPATISCIDLMALSVALNNIMMNFSTSISSAQWLLSGYTIGTASFLIAIGKLADTYGRRRLLLCGIFIFGFSSLIASISNSMSILIGCRFAQGIGSSAMMTTAISIITHTFSPEKRGTIIAKWGFFLGFGLAAGPLIGGTLLHLLNWRLIFIINVPICIIAYILTLYFVPESKNEEIFSKTDFLETILVTTFLVSLAAILSEGNSLGWMSYTTDVLFCIFLTTLISYIFIIYFRKNRLIHFELFKQPNFTSASFCGFISYFLMYAFLCVFTIYLQKTYGMSPLKAGLTCSSFSLAFILGSKLIQKTSHYIKNKAFLQLGFILAIFDFIVMAKINLQSNMWQLMIMFFLLGIAIIIINIPSMTEATTNVPTHKSGIASGIIFTIRWLGGSIGAITATQIFQTFGLKTACLSLALSASAGFICATLFIQKPNHPKLIG